MPTLADLQRHSPLNAPLDLDSERSDEVLVTDSRASLSPAQQVEQKLRGTLRVVPLLMSGSYSRRPLKPR